MTEQEEFEFRLRLERERGEEKPKASPAPPKRERTIADLANRPGIAAVRAPLETGLAMASGAIASPLSGYAGLLTGGSADTVRRVQDDLTYSPRGAPGRKLSEIASAPFQAFEEAAYNAGGAVSDVAGPGAGTAANVAIQSIPAAIAGGLARLGGGRAGAPGGAQPPAPRPTVPPDVSERVARGRALDVPVEYTRGQATREPQQLRSEINLAETKEGRPIRERHEGQNQALIENLDILKGKQKAKAATPEDVGRSVAGEGGALTLAERRSSLNVDKLYQDARKAGELDSAIDLKPIISAVAENPNASALLTQQLKAMNLLKEDGTGTATLNQLERARKRAVLVARTTTDGTMRHDAGELIKAIDAGTPEGVGGKAYQAARAARREHAMKFEEPKAISQLIENKTATDRTVALENVWDKTVRGGSIADLQRVKDMLIKDKDGREMGFQAWRDIRGATIDYIKNEATKGVAPDATGSAVLNPGNLKKALDTIGDRKLDIILGPATAQKVRNIAQVAADVKTLPPYRGGSTTVPNAMTTLLNVLEKAAAHVPVGSNLARGLVGKGKDIIESGAARKAAQEALRPADDLPIPPVSLSNLAKTRVSPLVPLVGGQQ